MRLLDATPRWAPSQRIAAALWISFLFAIAATGVVFSLFDPQELHYCASVPELSRTSAYTIGFLLIWLLTAATALATLFFVYPASSGSNEASHADD